MIGRRSVFNKNFSQYIANFYVSEGALWRVTYFSHPQQHAQGTNQVDRVAA